MAPLTGFALTPSGGSTEFGAGRAIVSLGLAFDHQGYLDELDRDPRLAALLTRIDEGTRQLGRRT